MPGALPQPQAGSGLGSGPGSMQGPPAGPQLLPFDLMAILQNAGIQPMARGGPSDVKQEQQFSVQVRCSLLIGMLAQ